MVKIQSERYLPGEHSVEVRYFISSLETSAARLLQMVRTHWQIENSLRWVLDIAFGEDDCRIRKDYGVERGLAWRV